jgi:hypothetical protein
LSRMFLMFFARVVPASNMANPACMTVCAVCACAVRGVRGRK